MFIISLKGKPMSTQHLYGQRGRIRYMKKEAKALKESYVRQVKEQYTGLVGEGEIEVYISLHFGDKRLRDWDNRHKLTMDAMEGIVYRNDTQIIRAVVEKFYCKGDPRIDIKIFNYNTQ